MEGSEKDLMTNQNNQALDVLVNKIVSIAATANQKLPYDKTIPSTVYGVNGDGTYTIIKANQEYHVPCALPAADICIGTNVWVKIPCGRMNEMHICGIR